MRLLVTGGRDYEDRELVFALLDALHAAKTISAIIEGGATGADRFAGEWADLHPEVEHLTLQARWDGLGPDAGSVRNTGLLELFQPTVGLSFPGGSGTRDMVAKLRGADIPTVEITDAFELEDVECLGALFEG